MDRRVPSNDGASHGGCALAAASFRFRHHEAFQGGSRVGDEAAMRHGFPYNFNLRGLDGGMAVEPSTIGCLDFDNALTRVNSWRGEMMENFARAEQAVTDALLVFNAVEPAIKGPRFPHLVGQRFDRLATCLAATATPSSNILAAESALSAFRTHEPLRAMLCHGVTKIALDRGGAWVAILRVVAFKAGGAAVSRQTVEQKEAQERLERLIKDRRRLCTALGQLRREIAV